MNPNKFKKGCEQLGANNLLILKLIYNYYLFLRSYILDFP
jgi:hypothetical protein